MTRSAALFVVALASSPVAAQPVNLTEKAAVGDKLKCLVELDLKGDLSFVIDGKKEPVRVEAKGRHAFTERVTAVADGMPASSARFYHEAVASAVVGGERTNRSLPAGRRLIVARRGADGLFCFSPAGPLTRDELDLVTEHFNPQCLPGLLPGKAVNVGDTWLISDAATRAACLFDAVGKAQLAGKLTAAKDGLATFAIDGTAEGVENGTKVAMSVSAIGTFDVASGRVTRLTWKQKDDRAQGPISPESQVEATVTLKREATTEVPKELADEVVAKIPDGELPASLTDLRTADAKNRYTVLHPRDWYVTGQTEAHVVFRLLDKGEFAAQATVSIWRKAEAGKHTPADEFKKAAEETPGWKPGRVLADGEVPAGAGRWLYRLSAEGKLDDQAVVQTFHLLAGPQGDQVAVTVVMKPDRAKAVGTRDLELVKAIEFGGK